MSTFIIRNKATREALSQSFDTSIEALEWLEGAELSTEQWEVTRPRLEAVMYGESNTQMSGARRLMEKTLEGATA